VIVSLCVFAHCTRRAVFATATSRDARPTHCDMHEAWLVELADPRYRNEQPPTPLEVWARRGAP